MGLLKEVDDYIKELEKRQLRRVLSKAMTEVELVDRLTEIFQKPQGGGEMEELRSDFRKLVAEYKCGVNGGNEERCLRYKPGRIRCTYRDGSYCRCE